MNHQKPKGLLYGTIERAVYENHFCKLFSKTYINHKGYKASLIEKLLLLFRKQKQWIIKSCNKSFLIEYKDCNNIMYILHYSELNGLHNTKNTP